MKDKTYRLGAFRLSPWRQLQLDNRPVAMGGKALDLLSVLASAEGNLVTKDELMAAVWPGLVIEENAIQVHISAARKALGDEARRVVTVHGRGYRLDIDPDAANGAATPLAQLPVVIVAPFANLTGDQVVRAFAEGLGDDIGSALARVKSLSVRTPLPEAARDPGSNVDQGSESQVSYLLEGSVDCERDRVCIRLRLTDTRDGTRVWSDKYDHALSDRFALQDEVAMRVAAAVEPAIEVLEARRLARSRADLIDGYDLYIQGWGRVFSYAEDDLLAGIALMEKAAELAPDLAMAVAGAGITHHDVYVFGWGHDPAFHRQRAMALLEHALRIGDDDANVLAWVACGLPVLSGNMVRARALVERALHANPSSANAWFAKGVIQQYGGRFAEAVSAYEAAERFAPFGFLSSQARLQIGACLGAQRDFAGAIDIIEAAGHPGPLPDICLAVYNAEAGRAEAAFAALDRLRALRVRPIPDFAALLPEAGRAVVPLQALTKLIGRRETVAGPQPSTDTLSATAPRPRT